MRRWLAGVVVVALVALMGWALVAVPLPLFVISPGSALQVSERIEFPTRAKDELSGQLLLTTVQISQPNTFQAVDAWLDDDKDVIQREQVIPDDVDPSAYFQAQRQVFEESGQLAAAAGLRAAGFPVTVTGNGAEVAAVSPNAPAQGVLREGDLITAAGDQPIQTASALVSAVSARRIGDELALTVRRDGTTTQLRVTLGRSAQQPGPVLGVAIRTVGFDIDLPFPVQVDAGQIGGPSAGLLMALTVYDLAEDGDLTRNRIIAGTGTIDAQGNVGPVGGVEQKIEAAVQADAQIFLAPAGEVDQARVAAGDRLQVIGVATLDDALNALKAPSSG
ncbi:MAG: YlbL family protein [Pseudonocardiaceae bacterium]